MYKEYSGAIQGKEYRPSRQLCVVAIENGAFGTPSGRLRVAFGSDHQIY